MAGTLARSKISSLGHRSGDLPLSLLPGDQRPRGAQPAQRGKVEIRYTDHIWIEDLIAWVEACGSAPVYSLLKREDEKAVTEQAYDQSDVRRGCGAGGHRTSAGGAGDHLVSGGCENFESIHNHSAYALVEIDWALTQPVDKSVETVEKLPCCRDYLNPVGENLLGIFAKEPVAGQVKTRLCPPLECIAEPADLYQTSLVETVARMSNGRGTPFFSMPETGFFAGPFPALARRRRRRRSRHPHGGGSCSFSSRSGRRGRSHRFRYPRPAAAHLQQAFAALQRNDVRHGPAADGGYVLIGERRHHAELCSRIFPGVPRRCLPRTRQRARERGLACAEVTAWEDIDDLASLRACCPLAAIGNGATGRRPARRSLQPG